MRANERFAVEAHAANQPEHSPIPRTQREEDRAAARLGARRIDFVSHGGKEGGKLSLSVNAWKRALELSALITIL